MIILSVVHLGNQISLIACFSLSVLRGFINLQCFLLYTTDSIWGRIFRWWCHLGNLLETYTPHKPCFLVAARQISEQSG